jgi:hypothetical protein
MRILMCIFGPVAQLEVSKGMDLSISTDNRAVILKDCKPPKLKVVGSNLETKEHMTA